MHPLHFDRRNGLFGAFMALLQSKSTANQNSTSCTLKIQNPRSVAVGPTSAKNKREQTTSSGQNRAQGSLKEMGGVVAVRPPLLRN